MSLHRLILSLVALVGVMFGAGIPVGATDDGKDWERRLTLSDNLLNLTYRSLIQSLDSQDRKVLRNAQRKWIEFRDAECDFPRGWRSRYNCLIIQTDERTKQLRTWTEVN